MTHMDGTPTSTYGTQSQLGQPVAPMPPAMHPGADMRGRGTYNSRSNLPGFLTTEFTSYVVASVLVLIASAVISDSSGRGDTDYFRADQAFTLITLLTVGYMLSRGIAKAGRQRDDDDF
jgi:hypothetical protein